MAIAVEIAKVVNDIAVSTNVTEVLVQAAIPAAQAGGAEKLDKTTEITNLEVVAGLPGPPNATTLYFVKDP